MQIFILADDKMFDGNFCGWTSILEIYTWMNKSECDTEMENIFDSIDSNLMNDSKIENWKYSNLLIAEIMKVKAEANLIEVGRYDMLSLTIYCASILW